MSQENEGAIDSTLQLFGSFRIWVSIAIGALVIIGSIFVLVMSFSMDSDVKRMSVEVVDVACEPSKRQQTCTQSRDGPAVCTSHLTTACDVSLQKATDSDGQIFKMQTVYEEGSEPQIGDQLDVYVDSQGKVRTKALTPQSRHAMRIGAIAIGTFAIIILIVNVIFRRNKNFKRLQGGLGVVGAVGGALR